MEKRKTALLIGASRGLGLALAQEFLLRGWDVVGTVREGRSGGLPDLGERFGDRLGIEYCDITSQEQIGNLEARLGGRAFDLLFVNAGVTNPRYETIGEVSTEEFVRVMTTNALSTMRVVERLAANVAPGGTIGVMSSGQGSVADNETGEFEVYRASKAALNMLMRSFAARSAGERTLLLIAPGWVKTDMGGPQARFTVAEVVPRIVDTILAQEGKKGLHYLDRFAKTIRW